MRMDGVDVSLRWRQQQLTWRRLGLVLVVGHAVILGSTVGLNTFDLILDAGLLALIVRPETYSLLELALPIWIFGVAYFDVLPLALRSRGPIHIADLYGLELRLFGWEGPAGRQIPARCSARGIGRCSIWFAG